MKKQILQSISRLAVWVLLLVSVPAVGNAASVRGRVDHIGANHRRTVMPGVAVIISGAMGRSAPIYTDMKGMYYLQNIPPGTYSLEVWVNGRPRPAVYRIQVNEPYTDIPPIVM